MYPVINPEEEEFNRWLSQQTMSGRIGGGNRLADLAQPQAMNTIRSSSGNVVDLNFAAKGGSGIRPDGSSVSYDPTVDGPRELARYQLPNGTFEVIKEVPVLDGFGRQSSRMIKEIETPAYLNPAALKQLDYQIKLTELQNKTKPKYELVQTEQGMFRIDPQSGRVLPVAPDDTFASPSAAPQQQAPQAATSRPQGTSAPFGAKTKPMTEDQSKATGYGMRAATSHEILNTVGDSGKVQPGIMKRIASSIPFFGEEAGTVMNWTQSPKQQQVEQAQRDFVNAILRRESGAVISQAEFDNATKQYFPQPGDSQEVIKQKQFNRENAIQALEAGSGTGVRQIQGARQKMQMIFEAQKAVKQGADKEAVKARLEQMGITNHGL